MVEKKQTIFGCFTTFYSSKVQNMLYLVGKYDTYKGSTHTNKECALHILAPGKYDTYKGSTQRHVDD